ncbi:MAG: NAD(P)-dependent oxidoreductase [Pseudomonadota bacterium]
MAVLVTGASGFLGGALVKRFAGAHDVRATGRNAQRLSRLERAKHLPLDLRNREAVLGDAGFDGVKTIIHCAALSSPWGPRAGFKAANVEATNHVIELAQKLAVDHLIFVSSPSVYFRFEDQLCVVEDQALPPPVNDYAATKAEAERLVKASGVPWTILRPRGLYGAGDTALLPRVVRAAKAGPLPLFRDGVAATDITHIDDVVAAVETMMENPVAAQGQAFNVSGGTALPIKDVVERVCAIEGIDLSWRRVPVGLALALVRAGEVVARLKSGQPEPRVTAYGLGIFAYSQTLDLSKIAARLGWHPQVGFEEGLARTYGGSQ